MNSDARGIHQALRNIDAIREKADKLMALNALISLLLLIEVIVFVSLGLIDR